MKGNGSESVGQWWDACHQGVHPEADFFLTGHAGPEVWEQLDVRSLLQPGVSVLNIGVGQGHCTRGLAELGCLVSALDISAFALNKVREVIDGGYLASALHELPENRFDVALSFLVVQHMSDTDFSTQLSAVSRALKPGGVFAFQYAYSLNPDASQENDTPEACKVGGVVRTAKHMEKLVANSGLELVRHWTLSEYPEFGSGWAAMQLEKKRS